MTDEYTIQISFKTPSQTLINLRGTDEQEISEQLDLLGRQLKGVGEIESILAAMNNLYTGMSPEEKIKADAEAAASRPAQQQAPSGGGSFGGQAVQQGSGGGGDVPICEHGPMQFKTGTSAKNGRPWSGFMCSGPRGAGQCSPQFDKVARTSL